MQCGTTVKIFKMCNFYGFFPVYVLCSWNFKDSYLWLGYYLCEILGSLSSSVKVHWHLYKNIEMFSVMVYWTRSYKVRQNSYIWRILDIFKTFLLFSSLLTCIYHSYILGYSYRAFSYIWYITQQNELSKIQWNTNHKTYFMFAFCWLIY